jgi:hypothetical protein
LSIDVEELATIIGVLTGVETPKHSFSLVFMLNEAFLKAELVLAFEMVVASSTIEHFRAFSFNLQLILFLLIE